MEDRRRLLRVTVVGEGALVLLPVDGADLAGGELVALLVADVRDALESVAAHRPRALERLLGVDERDTHALGGRVVLVDHRAPPLDHPPLDLRRTRRGGVDGVGHAGHVVALARGVGQLEHPHEHRGHPLRMRDVVLLDQPQGLLRVEAVHEDDRPTHRVDDAAEPQRGRVVQRCRAQVHAVGVEGVEEAEHGRVEIRHLVDLPLRQVHPYALGAAGGARRVEEVVAAGLVGGSLSGLTLQQAAVVLQPVEGAAERHPVLHCRMRFGREVHMIGHRSGHEQGACPAVADDVGRLLRGQMVVDRRDVEAGSQRPPVDLDHLEGVVRDHGDRVAGLEAPLVGEQVGELSGAGLELGVRDLLAGRGTDHGGLVGSAGGEGTWEHAARLTPRRDLDHLIGRHVSNTLRRALAERTRSPGPRWGRGPKSQRKPEGRPEGRPGRELRSTCAGAAGRCTAGRGSARRSPGRSPPRTRWGCRSRSRGCPGPP